MERIKRGLRLAKQSWAVIKQDRSLLIFPVLSAIFITIALSIVWGSAALGGVFADADSLNESNPVVIAIAIVSIYISTFLAIFFNVALASCASRSFEGHDTTVGEGLAAARDRVGQIAAWAFLATVVNVILRALEERLPLIGQIAVRLLGVAWTIATYLVVPVLAHERVGPIDALKRSGSIVRQRWGESITGNVGIGLITFLITFAIIVVFGGLTAALASSVPAALGVAAIGVVLVAIVAVVGSALTQVFNVAVYRFAAVGEERAPQIGPFSHDDLEHAFKPKKR
jgi:hypothetical protein